VKAKRVKEKDENVMLVIVMLSFASIFLLTKLSLL